MTGLLLQQLGRNNACCCNSWGETMPAAATAGEKQCLLLQQLGRINACCCNSWGETMPAAATAGEKQCLLLQQLGRNNACCCNSWGGRRPPSGFVFLVALGMSALNANFYKCLLHELRACKTTLECYYYSTFTEHLTG